MFVDNQATSHGGAMHAGYDLLGMIVNCGFFGNGAGLDGGAIYLTNDGNPTLANCVFSGNTATQDGGAIRTITQSMPKLANCSFSENGAGGLGGGLFLAELPTTVINTILWGNTDSVSTLEDAQIYRDGGVAVIIDYSCLEGWTGGLGGTGNFSSNPSFNDFDGIDNVLGTSDDDLSILVGSPCIDAAENLGVPPDLADVDNDLNTVEDLPVDMQGAPRFSDDPGTTDTGSGIAPIVDIGAFEFHPPCPADSNNDFQVDVLDLVELLASWGPCPAPCAADSNNDGQVDVLDLVTLLAGWGTCP